MPSERTERIKMRAYLIWEREGRPHDRAEQHWAQATHEIDNEEEAGADVPSAPAKRADVTKGNNRPTETEPDAGADSADRTGKQSESPLERRR
jgi:hypothetical protein